MREEEGKKENEKVKERERKRRRKRSNSRQCVCAHLAVRHSDQQQVLSLLHERATRLQHLYSMFLFLSLAMAKRYTELFEAVKAGATGAAGRGYRASDLPALLSLGTSAGYAAVLIMALYINSPESLARYGESNALWLICPLTLYWISRVWMLSSRGRMTDDPIVFALTDRVSLGVIGAMAICVMIALWTPA